MSRPYVAGDRRGPMTVASVATGEMTLRWPCGHERTVTRTHGIHILNAAEPRTCHYKPLRVIPCVSCPEVAIPVPCPEPSPKDYPEDDDPPSWDEPIGGAWLLHPCAEGEAMDLAWDAADALARRHDPAERAEGQRRQAVLRGLEDERAAAILRRERGLAPDAELPPGAIDAARRRTT